MSRLHLPFTLALAVLSTLALGAAGCSSGQSPTEPARLDAGTKSSLDVKRHGADDPAGDDHAAGRGAVAPAIRPETITAAGRSLRRPDRPRARRAARSSREPSPPWTRERSC
jgi:hypothetical protein